MEELQAHASIARDSSLSDESVLLLENGDVVELVADTALVVGKMRPEEICVDGSTIGAVDEKTLRERRQLAEAGVISGVVVVDAFTGQLVGEPVGEMRGVPIDHFASARAVGLLRDVASDWSSQDLHDLNELKAAMRRELTRWIKRAYSLQPIVAVTALSVPS
jgi:ribonuclease J